MGRIKVKAFILGALAFALVAGCALEQKRPDWNTGGDHKRDLAKLAPLGRAITDSVNAPKGDNTDWKYLQIPSNGQLIVKVSVDNPKVGANILLYDNLGQPLERQHVNGQDLLYKFETEVQEGRYFVQMQTSKFQTVYTVASEFEPEAEPEPEPTPEPVAVTRKPRKRRRRAAAAPAPQAKPGTVIIVGKVINKIAWDEGKKTRITFNKGSMHGVKGGATAVISGGPTMKVKQVFESSSVGFAKVKEHQITANTKVTITVTE